MKTSISILLAAAALTLSNIQTSQAQYNNELGFSLGGSNYLGDIGGKEKIARRFVADMKLNQTNLMGGIYARHKFNGYYSIKGALNIGKISGDDQLSENTGRNTRNLRFKNNIKELTFLNELHIFELADVGSRGTYQFDMQGYIFAGVNVFHHNPKGRIDGQATWYQLKPLQTEGMNYSNWGIGIPAGVGINVTYRRQHKFGWDLTWTTTFTDYLDDISSTYLDDSQLDSQLARRLANQSDLSDQSNNPSIIESFKPGSKRGESSYNDSYLFSSISYGYIFRSMGDINIPKISEGQKSKAKFGNGRTKRYVF
jgi:uncharacterized protein YkuJ